MSKHEKVELAIEGIFLGVCGVTVVISHRNDIREWLEERKSRKEEHKKTKRGYMRMK